VPALLTWGWCLRSRTTPISKPTPRAVSKPIQCAEVFMTKETSFASDHAGQRQALTLINLDSNKNLDHSVLAAHRM
jgi:hypothetical protein